MVDVEEVSRLMVKVIEETRTACLVSELLGAQGTSKLVPVLVPDPDPALVLVLVLVPGRAPQITWFRARSSARPGLDTNLHPMKDRDLVRLLQGQPG